MSGMRTFFLANPASDGTRRSLRAEYNIRGDSILRKTSAIALMIAMGGTMAYAETKPAAKDIVIVHCALVDASGWRAVYDILTKDGFHVTIVQEPSTSLADDVEATKRTIDRQAGPDSHPAVVAQVIETAAKQTNERE